MIKRFLQRIPFLGPRVAAGLSRIERWSALALGFSWLIRGVAQADRMAEQDGASAVEASKTNTCRPANPLREFFNARETGPGIWKWEHYFPIYQRHGGKFVGQSPRILEIGIYSGGSLDLWRNYFGAGSHIYGLDIEESCRVYQSADVTVHIGDQGSRSFWQQFRKLVPPMDLVIDDGGHHPRQQMITLEEILGHIRPGGVYVCEDIHGELNNFAFYAAGLIQRLNAMAEQVSQPLGTSVAAAPFQAAVYSLHFYPYVFVIEKSEIVVDRFLASRRGTEWQPFAARAQNV